MKKTTINKVILQRSDFSVDGLNLGIWDALTENLPLNTEQVEVLVIRKYA